MIPRIQVAAIVLIGAGALSSFGAPVSWQWARYVGGAITVVGLALSAFDLWLWRLGFLQGWFVKRPHLWGVWNVTIATNWIDEETGQQLKPVKATFTIRQTYFSIHVKMKSAESIGELLCANVLTAADGEYQLIGTYRNEPNATLRDRSSIYYGTFRLNIQGRANSPTSMNGAYWTDRITKGEIRAVRAKED